MKYVLLTLLLLKSLTGCLAQENVLFGEVPKSGNVTAVFFDREGSIYPEYFIPDSSLRGAGSSLRQWYKRHPADFRRIAMNYHCAFTTYTGESARVLNDSITVAARRIIDRNKGSSKNAVTFLVHGFRKRYTSINGDTPSPADYTVLEAAIDRYTTFKTAFVTVYWDGMYGTFSKKNLKQNRDLLRSFETARENAAAAGRSLRFLMAGLAVDTLNVVTHSLGAEVACSALFDTCGSCCTTPVNKVVHICLIAPAIGGEERFKSYCVRNPQKAAEADNYRLCIVYNTNDFVLKKKYGILGPGPYKYGETTLGCSWNGTATNLQAYFKEHYPTSAIELVDLSDAVSCHHISCYAAGDNLKPMVAFMRR